MIVSRIDGGLGNQLFQYAFGLQLAHVHKTELVLDLSSYSQGPQHGLLLDRFKIAARSLATTEEDLVPRRYRSAKKPFWHDLLSGGALRRVKESPFGFAERYLRADDDSYLVGYWQSERFFPDVCDQLRSQFDLAAPMSEHSARIAERLECTPSLALHIRRGDYLSNPQAAAIYRNLSLEYYRRAVLARLTERTGVEVTVFSNDVAWCQQNLKLPCPTHYVTRSDGPHEELVLMSWAEALVMANSTFSWWSAWLTKRTEPRIFAPRKWFLPGTLNDRHLACPGWTLLDDPFTQTAAA